MSQTSRKVFVEDYQLLPRLRELRNNDFPDLAQFICEIVSKHNPRRQSWGNMYLVIATIQDDLCRLILEKMQNQHAQTEKIDPDKVFRDVLRYAMKLFDKEKERFEKKRSKKDQAAPQDPIDETHMDSLRSQIHNTVKKAAAFVRDMANSRMQTQLLYAKKEDVFDPSQHEPLYQSTPYGYVRCMLFPGYKVASANGDEPRVVEKAQVLTDSRRPQNLVKGCLYGTLVVIAAILILFMGLFILLYILPTLGK